MVNIQILELSTIFSADDNFNLKYFFFILLIFIILFYFLFR